MTLMGVEYVCVEGREAAGLVLDLISGEGHLLETERRTAYHPLPPKCGQRCFCAFGNSVSRSMHPDNFDYQDVPILGLSHASGGSWSQRCNVYVKSCSWSSRNSE